MIGGVGKGSPSVEAQRGRIRVQSLTITAEPLEPFQAGGRYQFWQQVSTGLYTTNNSSVLVPRGCQTTEPDYFQGVYGRPLVAVRDVLNGHFELVMQAAHVSHASLKSTAERFKLGVAEFSLPGSAKEPVLAAVFSWVGPEKLYVISFAGQGRRPKEQGYFSIEVVIDVAVQLVNDSTVPNDVSVIKEAIEHADLAFRD